MLKLDAQIHVWLTDRPSRPWDPSYRQRYRNAPSFLQHAGQSNSPDNALAEMAEAGVDGAVLSTLGVYGFSNEMELQAAAAHHDRFCAVGVIDHLALNVQQTLVGQVSRGLRGLRLSGLRSAEAWESGEHDRLLRLCDELGLVVMLPSVNSALTGHLPRYPRAFFMLNHLGTGLAPPIVGHGDPHPFARLDEVVAAANLPNLGLKLTGLPALSAEAFPFRDIWGPIRRVLAAYGADRLAWGSDYTRTAGLHSYLEGAHYLEVIDGIGADDLAMLLGGTVSARLNWRPVAEPGLRYERPLRGILYRIGAAVCLVATGICIKAAVAIPAGEAVFFRSLVSFLLIALLAGWRGNLRAVAATPSPLGHVRRGLIGAAGIFCLFAAYSHLPLTEVTTMLYACPFLIVAASALFLGEQVGRLRWFAVAVGFTGVLAVAWPRLSLLASGAPVSGGGTLGLLFALGAIMMNVAATFAVRDMVGRESSWTITFYFSLISALAALLTLPLGWAWPSPAELALLAGAGTAGAFQHFLLAESFRHARMSVVAPFEYSSLLFATLAGVFLFAEWPGLYTVAGGALVVASGIMVVAQQARRVRPG